MNRSVLLPALCACVACSDIGEPASSPVNPLSESVASQAVASAADKWQFEATLTFVGTVQPEEARVTPSGVIHANDLINEFEMTGDIEGTFYFIGKYHLNTRNGKGRSINAPGLIVITSPGSGTFECRGSAKIEGFPLEFVQYGKVAGCTGGGDYTGMQMKLEFSNEANPGVNIYPSFGEIW